MKVFKKPSFLNQPLFTMSILSGLLAAPSLAAAQDCNMIGRFGATVLLKAETSKADGSTQPILFCIRYGSPNIIETRQTDGKLLFRSRYEGQKALSTENFAINKTLEFVYSDVLGEPSNVRDGEVARFRLETLGAAIPLLSVEIAGQGKMARTVSGCPFDVVQLRRTNRQQSGAGSVLNIIYAPTLGWAIESKMESLPGQVSRSPQTQTTIIQSIGASEETDRICGNAAG